MATAEAPAPTAPAKKAWHALTVEDALKDQGVEESAGLSAVEVQSRRAKFGSNKFADAPRESRLTVFLRQYADPMQIVLLVAGIVSLFIPNQFATGVLRRAYSSHVRQAIRAEVEKDYVKMPIDEIMRHLVQ